MVWSKFKYIYLVLILLTIMQIYFAVFAQPLDRIWSVTANLPLIWLMVMHAISPLILNPNAYPSEWTSDIKPNVKRAAAFMSRLFRRVKQRQNKYSSL